MANGATPNRLRRRNRELVAQELRLRGGCCAWPGCTETIVQWHHKDPRTKDANVGRIIGSAGAERLRTELEKCIPYCDQHHRLREAVRRVENGTHHGKAYCYERLGCRQPECIEAARSKWRNAARRRRTRELELARRKKFPALRRMASSSRRLMPPALPVGRRALPRRSTNSSRSTHTMSDIQPAVTPDPSNTIEPESEAGISTWSEPDHFTERS